VQNVIHFWDSYLKFFPRNLGCVSNENGEHSIKKYKRWRSYTRANGDSQSVCWVTAAGHW
jgi:hypothetical protein